MFVFVRRAVTAALLGLAPLALAGCDATLLHVVIPDYESASVDGIQVWRLDDATGNPMPRGRLVFGQELRQDGKELVEYTIQQPDGSQPTTLPAVIQRSSSNPDQIEVKVFYIPTENPGWHKVSTYNSAGSSPLSTAQTYF